MGQVYGLQRPHVHRPHKYPGKKKPGLLPG
jgi:hypothetical protein